MLLSILRGNSGLCLGFRGCRNFREDDPVPEPEARQDLGRMGADGPLLNVGMALKPIVVVVVVVCVLVVVITLMRMVRYQRST